MMDLLDPPFLKARFADVSKIPSTRLEIEMLVTIYLTATLAYFTYGLRMYSRISTKQIGLEDWLMTAATILSMAFMAAQYLYLKYNYAGVPESELPKTVDVAASNFSVWLTQLLYSPVLGLVKSSTLVFMLRIAGHIRNIKLAIHVFNVINICLTVATVLVTIFATIPISGYWDPKHQVQHEINHSAFIMTTSFLTILTDILVLSIPFWAFIRTQLPLATRLGVIMIFMTGGLVTAFGIVRFCVLAEQYWEPPQIRFMETWGPTYAATEANLAIITACLPALRPILRKWFPKAFGNSSTEDSGALGEERGHYTGGRSVNDASIRMQDFSHKRGNVRCGSDSTTESHKALFKSAGIRKTTDIHVSYSTPRTQNSGEAARKDNTPEPSSPALTV